MNTKDSADYDVGVIVGRFQVPELHEGHRALIDSVFAKHSKVIIVLGQAPTINTTTNPLDFESRYKMLTEAYPNAIVQYLADVNNDAAWSKQLDTIIRTITSPTQSVVLYGGRDSFIDSYNGIYDTHELMQEGYQSGTEIRNAVRQQSLGTRDFRHGVIWASANRFPVVYTCVDVAIFSEDNTRLLLGQKPYEDKWRLIGGFADPGSRCFEDDAYREVLEEARVGLTNLRYCASFTVEDWRYRKEPDCIRTLLFIGHTDTMVC